MVEYKCPVCQEKATSRCSRCKSVWYCGAEHQRQHWKAHKSDCNDAHKADQLTLHKQEFDRIVKKYKLDSEQQSEQIANFLTKADNSSVSPAEFADKFEMKVEEAVVFLEWIKVGIKFKEETADVAKKSGLGGR
mmetsp:Transcript_132417/g.197335  ORF Transcript_132417/g.197335 Transcript_132417/m.197335 type:complete len:134 (+) Transcript_132417:111-512(+)